jgi:hypothetical protein
MDASSPARKAHAHEMHEKAGSISKKVAAPSGWLFWNLMAHPLLGEEDSTSPPRWL